MRLSYIQQSEEAVQQHTTNDIQWVYFEIIQTTMTAFTPPPANSSSSRYSSKHSILTLHINIIVNYQYVSKLTST